MKIDPTVAKRILDSEDGKKMAEFITQTILSLDTVRDIKATDPAEIALEVKARGVAIEKLEEILTGLFFGRDSTQPGEGGNEFSM